MSTTRYFYRDPAAPRPEGPPSLGVVAVIESDGSLLLDCRLDGRWGLVGGAVEADESLAEALRREVMEETGLRVRGYTLLGTYSSHIDAGRLDLRRVVVDRPV